MNNKQIMLIALVSFICAGVSYAQEAFQAEQPYLKNIKITYGKDHGVLRDFATSPLFYRSNSHTVSTGYVKGDHAKESSIGFQTLTGFYSAEVDGDIVGTASVTYFTFHWTKLYQVKRFSDEYWNVKVGGTFVGTGGIRSNPTFQNNAIGLEAFFNLMASGKVSRDLSRTEAKSGKFLFVNYNLEPRVRKLSYQLNLGLLNTNVRNGYVYTRHGTINEPFPGALLNGYEFNANGFRMSADLDYTMYFRKNLNALILGYSYDGVKTGGDLDKMEYSTHVFSLSLLVNLK